MSRELILGSGSASRLALLHRAGLDPIVDVSGIDETARPGENIDQRTDRLASEKAARVAERHADAIVIACDSMLELDNQAYGKPHTPARAREQWRRQGGRTGHFHTGHCLIDTATGRRHVAHCITQITFAEPAPSEVDAYVATGEPLEVAGAFKLDSLGLWFVRSVSGDPGNLHGLSLSILRAFLDQSGIAVSELWRSPASIR